MCCSISVIDNLFTPTVSATFGDMFCYLTCV